MTYTSATNLSQMKVDARLRQHGNFESTRVRTDRRYNIAYVLQLVNVKTVTQLLTVHCVQYTTVVDCGMS